VELAEHPASPEHSSTSPDTSLPIWTSCVFVDWHGVLSEEVFWKSILTNETHELNRSLERAVRDLFGANEGLVENWMRGSVSMEQVVARLDVSLNRRYRADFLVRRLMADCRQMQPRSELLEPLRQRDANDRVLRTLATDNMDCFFSGAERLWKSPDRVFDGALCSSELGVLKAEDPQRFFGQWLEDHGLEPADALLVDDSAENCRAFERWGGTAVHYSCQERAVTELQAWLSQTIER
jgi:HAD superfamily hydrolase (TIGR01509 family)